VNGDVTVRMRPGWAVFLDDRLYGPGAVLELDPRTAAHWCHRGWAEFLPDDPEGATHV
jgi:hypothetical protein